MERQPLKGGFMRAIMTFMSALTIALFFSLSSCSGPGDSETNAVFQQDRDLAAIKPTKPVKIKLKRTAKGSYSWDLSGSDVEEILKADGKLQEFLLKAE
jgi:hypothetical protein